MKSQRAWRVVTASVAVAGMSLTPSPVSAAAGPVFGASSVSHTYNFSLEGRSADGRALVMVGWIQVGDDGAVTAGGGRASVSVSGLPLSTSVHLDGAASNHMVVSDATNGIYDLRLRFLSQVLAPTELNLSVLLDDPRGRSGRLSGDYRFASTELGGVGIGEIVSQ